MNLSTDRLTTYALMLLIFLFALNDLQIPSLPRDLLGGAFFALCIFLTLMIITRKGITKRQLYTFLPFILFLMLYIINFNNLTKPATFTNTLYQGFYVLFAFIVSSLVWKKSSIKAFSLLFYAIFPILLSYIISEKEGINTNSLGTYALFLSFFPALYIVSYRKLKSSRLLILFGAVLTTIFLSGTRSVMLSVVFGIITLAVWKFISKNKTFFKLYFLSILAFIFTYTVVYPRLDKILVNFNQYNYFIIEHTGKGILSGRDRLWSFLIDVIAQKPLIGHGSGAIISDFMRTTLSAHNLYLQIALQVGLIGVTILAIFLLQIWKVFWVNRYDPKVILAACYYVGILIYQVNEISLLQNDPAVNLLQWLTIGLGLSYCFNKQKEQVTSESPVK